VIGYQTPLGPATRGWNFGDPPAHKAGESPKFARVALAGCVLVTAVAVHATPSARSDTRGPRAGGLPGVGAFAEWTNEQAASHSTAAVAQYALWAQGGSPQRRGYARAAAHEQPESSRAGRPATDVRSVDRVHHCTIRPVDSGSATMQPDPNLGGLGRVASEDRGKGARRAR
jgi:hypothetical protein